ncbi:MAG: fused MFS/spermidine synthase [Nitrospirae bacterium]|nr:fused MFS/spermidine synthase [Nitrospirota bacterium]
MGKDRIKGDEICRRRDEYGEIIIAEEGNKRTLYFGEGIIQSTIQTDRPDLLLEDYNEAMMSGLLFKCEPESVLLIGLGGCSLVHFLLKALPDSAIDVVEIRQQVIDLSKDYFRLPADNTNLRIFHAAGEDFIGLRRAYSHNYDIIIVDAFDETGPAAPLLDKDFLSSCRMQLNKNGVFIMNLWNSPKHDFHALYKSIQDAFENNTLKLLLSESYRNAVAFGFENPAACRHLPDYRCTAADLQRKHRINFPRYLKHLYWQNFDDQDQ